MGKGCHGLSWGVCPKVGFSVSVCTYGEGDPYGSFLPLCLNLAAGDFFGVHLQVQRGELPKGSPFCACSVAIPGESHRRAFKRRGGTPIGVPCQSLHLAP